jgi:hypothetical protein
MQEAEYDKTTPKVARNHLEVAAHSTAQVVKYKNSKAVTEAAYGDRFFDWVKDQVRSAHPNPLARSIPVAGGAQP